MTTHPTAADSVADVIVLIAALVALLAALLILGIVGYGLVGQLSRLRRAIGAAQADVAPRVRELTAQLPTPPPQGRHSAER